MEQEHRQLSREERDKMEAEQMPPKEAVEAETDEFEQFDKKQKEKFADAAAVEIVLDGFKNFRSVEGRSPEVTEAQEEFRRNFENVRSQLRPYFEKYGVSEPACFQDIEPGDSMPALYYDVKLAGYGLLRENLSR